MDQGDFSKKSRIFTVFNQNSITITENRCTQLEVECTTKHREPRIKARYFVLLISFIGETLLFAHRLNMSIGLVAMVNSSVSSVETESPKSCLHLIESDINDTREKFEYENGEFQWSDTLQGYILGSGFFSFSISLTISAKLAEMYGGKKMLLYCTFLASLFTFISPFAAYWSVYALMTVQFLRGFSQAGLVPAPVMLIINWFPKQERGLAYTVLISGGPAGAVVGSYLTGLLYDSNFLGGWPSAFFISGLMGLIFCITVFFCLHDNPSVHPNLSPVEKEYILSNQENVLTEKRPKTPWKILFTSVPVWALFYAYFGTGWANSHFISANPIFLKTILHYSVKQDGLFSAIPFLLQIITSQLGGIISTMLINKGYISIDKSRKLLTFISTFGYSMCVLGIYFSECNRFLAVFFSIGALSFVGFNYAGCLIASADMSPTFAASIDCITCVLGTVANFALPVAVGYLTDGSQTLEQWHKIFFISIAIVLSSGLVFVAFGSAELQPWNDISNDKSQNVKEKGDE